MKHHLTIIPEAEHDLLLAYNWYELNKPGLGSIFLFSVESTLFSIERSPKIYAAVDGVFRRALLRRFPFAVYYVEKRKHIYVIAFFHVKQDLKKMKKRKNIRSSLFATLEETMDPHNLKEIKSGLKQIKKGDVISWQSLKKKYRL